MCGLNGSVQAFTQVASSLDSIFSKFLYSNFTFSMGESCHPQGATPGGDLLDDLRGDLASDPLCWYP